MALRGDVETIPLRHLLGWLSEQRASGLLSLNRGAIARSFHLWQGQVMLSSTTEEDMLLGRLLVARGMIDATQLAAALDTRAGTRRHLGSALTRAGLLSPAQLRGVLTEKVRRLLIDALNWTDGGFSFDEAEQLPQTRPGVAAVVDLAEVLAMAPDIYAAAAPDDVIVTDDDIVETAEVLSPRPPAEPRPALRKKASAGRPSPRLPRARTRTGSKKSPPGEAS
ncbi:MAG: DUF4388 domain-containing protein [Pseudomonadota bacterium]